MNNDGAGPAFQEDDPVVEELDVFLSQELADRLYLLQYPLRPTSRPYIDGSGNAPGVKIKPEQDKLEMTYALNTGASTYDQQQGKELADATLPPDNPSSSKVPMYPSGVMDSQVLRSSKVPMRTHYVAGMFCEDGLHLTPLKAILQLRPTFDHINEAENRKIEKAKGGKAHEEEFNTVKTRLARIESERAQAARMRSHSHMQEQSDAEPWIEVKYLDAASPAAEVSAAEMQSQDVSREIRFTSEAKDWLEELHQEEANEETSLLDPLDEVDDRKKSTAVNNDAGVSLHDIRQMDLNDQVEMLMKQAQVMQYRTLRGFTNGNHTDASILACLQGCGWYVGGAWVVQSRIIAPKEKCTTNHGSNARSFIQARDLILRMFQKGEAVVPNDIIEKTGFNSDDVREILRKFAKVRVQSDGFNRWEFIFKSDPEFAAQFPAVVAQEKAAWNGSRGDSIDAAVMSATNAESGGGGVDVSSGYAGGRSTLAAMDGQREFLSSKAPAEMLAEEIEFEDELTIKEKTIAEIAKDVVSAALRKHGVVSVSLVNEVLDLLPTQNRAFLEHPGGPLAELPAGRTAEVVKAAFDAVGTQMLDVTHRAGVELYVLTTPVWKNKVSAEYRTLILNLLQESKRIKKAAITQTCVSAGLAQIPTNIYQKIVHELAVNTGGQWSLKSGDGN